MSEVPRGHLPPLPPLFAPPPFTPSHPVFQHFKSLASSESERAREAAEEYLNRIAQEKAAELQAKEVELKREVEVLWSRFREGIDKLQQEPGTRFGLHHPWPEDGLVFRRQLVPTMGMELPTILRPLYASMTSSQPRVSPRG